MRTALRCAVVLVGFAVHAQAQVVTDMTPALVQEAIASGGSGLYKLQERTIWGDGPELGYFTTPYSRVALAAALARKAGKPFAPADVTPDMLLPELHVYATSQAIYGNKNRIANVEAVIILPEGSKDRSAAIQPTRITDVAEELRSLVGARTGGRSVMVVFPLSALNEHNELQVEFDRHVPGSSSIKGCTECSVRFKLDKVR